jgi:uncharacterized SAM-binding protein YcdF (DUF218 family)
MIYLHKILPLIASPLFIVIVFVLWGSIRGSKKVSFTGIAILIICSLPVLSNRLIAFLERNYRLESTKSFETADAIVVLSGMVRAIQGKNGLAYEWNEASDRIFAGIDLFKENRSSILIFTRGALPWSVGKPEGEYLRDVAIKFGIPHQNILLTMNVENTDQEAKSVRELLTSDKPKIILVTSAFHMPRAQTVFEAAGLAVLPFPVDFLSGVRKMTFMDFMPSADALRYTSLFVREMIGRTYYRLKY